MSADRDAIFGCVFGAYSFERVSRGGTMARKIVILSDGTGNAASSVWRTNVWRMFQSLKLDSLEQAARYDDGVGTSSFKPIAILGGAFGYGLKRNVLESYKFICRNYEENSKLYFFGFSRGAFTVRVLCALILQQGIIKAKSDAELNDLARKAYRVYRANGYKSILRIEQIGRWVRDLFVGILDGALGRTRYKDAERISPPSVEFIGVWDTVAAYGLPADEMTRGISDWIWPLELPNRVLHKDVLCARHALAIDDERTTFHPVLWTEKEERKFPDNAPYKAAEQRLVQVWFTGMHANVGGGYPDDALAFTPLYWLMREAKARGLVFKEEPEADPDTAKWMKAGRDPDGRLYDSRAGIGGYYRYGPRNIYDLCNDKRAKVEISVPKIHESVFERIDSGCNSYAPIGLPERYAIVMDDGTILPVGAPAPDGKSNYETQHTAKLRAAAQDRLWNYVWLRRVFYFLTLGATFYLALFWLFHSRVQAQEFETPIRMVSELLRAVQSILPSWTRWWVDVYATNPIHFVIGGICLAIFLSVGSSLRSTIHDKMRSLWLAPTEGPKLLAGVGHRFIHGLRTSRGYKSVVAAGKFWVLPGLFALITLVVVVTAASHVLFNIADSFGAYCTRTADEKTVDVNLGIPQSALSEFSTNALCAPTGLVVKEGYRYEIILDVLEEWRDGDINTTPVGFLSSSRPFVQETLFRSVILLRRILWRPWFRAIARVGEKGVDEYFLDPKRVKDSPTAFRDTFRARRSGEVFLYVNDAVVGLPGLSSVFYDGTISRGENRGRAKVTIRLCKNEGC